MKCKEMAAILDALSLLPESSGNHQLSSGIRELADVVRLGANDQVKKFVAYAKPTPCAERHHPGSPLLEIRALLISFDQLARLTSRKTVISDIGLVSELIGDNKEGSVADFSDSVRAQLTKAKPPSRKRSKVPTVVRADVVDTYAQQLILGLDGSMEFMPVFEKMKSDRSVRQQEAAAIAAKVLGSGPKSAAKAKAFQRILSRHESRIDLDAKLEALSGRTAS